MVHFAKMINNQILTADPSDYSFTSPGDKRHDRISVQSVQHCQFSALLGCILYLRNAKRLCANEAYQAGGAAAHERMVVGTFRLRGAPRSHMGGQTEWGF